VKLPFRIHADDNVTSVPIKPRSADKNFAIVENNDRKHYLIDFFRINYVWAIFSRAPWYFCLYSLLVLLVDLVLRKSYNNFVRLFARRVLNKTGLVGQYVDMLTYSQASICSGKLQHYLTVHFMDT